MPSSFQDSNAVVVARHFNPSVFSQLWLLRHGVVGEHDATGGCVFSDNVVKVESRQFDLLVIPPQLQFRPKVEAETEMDLIVAKVGQVIEALPHTPYLAAGLNFTWLLWPEDGDLQSQSKDFFLRPDGPFCDSFGDARDAMFGAYFSKDIEGCRLRLDVKPVDLPSDNAVQRSLQFAFNFQVDISKESNAVELITTHLNRWNILRRTAQQIVAHAEDFRK